MAGIALVAIIVGPSFWVQRVMHRYATPSDRYQGSGEALARHLLDQEALPDVQVERAPAGQDHYDPEARTVRLSPGNFDGCSLTAIVVAAHEVGHAVQHGTRYRPLELRTRLVRALAPMERIGAAILFLAPLFAIATRAPVPALVWVLAGFLVLGSTVLVHAVTLPMEINASFARALPLLKKHGILIPGDEPHARRILKAAALTYAAAALISLFNIARWWTVLRR